MNKMKKTTIIVKKSKIYFHDYIKRVCVCVCGIFMFVKVYFNMSNDES